MFHVGASAAKNLYWGPGAAEGSQKWEDTEQRRSKGKVRGPNGCGGVLGQGAASSPPHQL